LDMHEVHLGIKDARETTRRDCIGAAGGGVEDVRRAKRSGEKECCVDDR
jgi:hypothetical protein